jgi:hypothetical protein
MPHEVKVKGAAMFTNYDGKRQPRRWAHIQPLRRPQMSTKIGLTLSTAIGEYSLRDGGS